MKSFLCAALIVASVKLATGSFDTTAVERYDTVLAVLSTWLSLITLKCYLEKTR